ncbi:hypothetical protein FQR65_LT03432 [Abscondita terminalis]|nr:hypothetical protein FQR65_LT03432 [Abscondita terminalis]
MGAGSNPNLVGVVINGKRGYIPKETFMENSIKVPPTFEEDTEKVEVSDNDNQSKSVNLEPAQPFVFEGTTIPGDIMNTESENQSNMTDTNQETPPLNPNSSPKTLNEGAVPTVVTIETSNIVSSMDPSSDQRQIDSPKADEESKPEQVLVEQNQTVQPQIENEESKTHVTEIPLGETRDTMQQAQPQTPKEIVSVIENNDSIATNFSAVNLMNEGDDGSGEEEVEEEEEGSTDELEDEDGVVEEEVDGNTNSDVREVPSLSPEATQLELQNETTTSSSESNNIQHDSPKSPEPLQVEDVGVKHTEPDDSVTVSSSDSNSIENEVTEAQQQRTSEIGTENANAEEKFVSEQLQSETAVSHENDINVDTPQEQAEVFNQTYDHDKSQDQSATMEISKEDLIQTEYLQNAPEVKPVINEVANENPDVVEQQLVEETNRYYQQNIEVTIPPSENQIGMDNSNYANDQETFKEETVNEIEQVNKLETETLDRIESHKHDFSSLISQHIDDTSSCSADPLKDCNIGPQDFRAAYDTNNIYKIPNSAILTVLVIAAVTVVTFLWGYIYMEKRGRESNLVGKINNIQKEYLIVQKQNEMLKDKLDDVEVQFNEKANAVSNEMLVEAQEQLEKEKNSRLTLELQIQNLEKELENSTEVGLELNRMLSEFLNSENGSETLVANIEQLQRQLVEQQGIINAYNENLSMKETENHELRLEVDINNTKVTELQSELNKMTFNLLKFEEDKEQLQSICESDLQKVKEELESNKGAFMKEKNKLKEQLQDLKDKYEQIQKDYELKCNEYMILKEGISQIKKIENNGDALKSLLDMSSIQAELLQLRKEKQLLIEQLQDERNKSGGYEVKCQSAMKDLENFKEMYDEADREKVEAVTKLQVLDKYFKEREAQLQKELNKQESMWIEKQGEATSTIERIKYMQEELQNYKAQNESLKQEILEQEVQMKSQISVLEKKAHENWVTARQAERKLEDAKQEAAQLRNRLTLRERSFTEDKIHNRVQSPLEQNGEVPVSPSHIPNDTAASPLLFGTRENLTISPPLPGLPFLPPPPGVPFMPPTLGGVPLPPPGFMPPPPSLMPGDHRPPPLGRISSPPLNSRYSPDRGYSPYSRNSPSPTSDDDYDRIPHPPMYRGYNSYNRDDRREIHRPPPVRGNPRNNKGRWWSQFRIDEFKRFFR